MKYFLIIVSMFCFGVACLFALASSYSAFAPIMLLCSITAFGLAGVMDAVNQATSKVDVILKRITDVQSGIEEIRFNPKSSEEVKTLAGEIQVTNAHLQDLAEKTANGNQFREWIGGVVHNIAENHSKGS